MSGKKTPSYVQFSIAGISGMSASLFVHPLDLLKNRMQLSGIGNTNRLSLIQMVEKIYIRQGIGGFYEGLSAGLLRQATYGSSRIGIYLWFMNYYNEKHNMPPDFYVKILLGSISGVFGAVVGTPSEVILVRMTADGLLQPELRRNYSNALTAVIRIIQEENIRSLWKGLGSTTSRAMVANAAELSAYSQTKQFLLSTSTFKDTIQTHFICSIVASFTNVTFSLPFDIAKTRIQNMRTDIINHGPIKVITQIIKNEGITALWKGFVPCFACIGPRTILMFIFIEYLTKSYQTFFLLNDSAQSGL